MKDLNNANRLELYFNKTRMRRLGRFVSKPIILVLLFFIITRLYLGLTTSFFVGDEANYVHMYFQFLETGRPDVYGELAVKPAGMFYLTAPILAVFVPLWTATDIPIEIPFRIVGIIFGIATLWILYNILLKLSKSEQGAAAGTFFFSIFPNFSLISMIYSPDIFVILFSLLSIWILLWREDWKGALIAGFFTGFAFYIKFQQAFLIFALILPFMIFRKRIRWDYFVFSMISSAIFLLIFIASYYPAHLDSALLLLKTESFARHSISVEPSLYAIFIYADLLLLMIFLFAGLVIWSKKYLKNKSIAYEISQIFILMLFFIVISPIWYTALLFFGPSLLLAKVFEGLWKFEKIVIGTGILLIFFLSVSSVNTLSHHTAYDWASQKELGLFLIDKYPVTFVMDNRHMDIWGSYEEVYNETTSPVLLAKMRMAILPYKFLYEEKPRISDIDAQYYNDADLEKESPPVFESKYVVTERKYEKFLETSLEKYALIRTFGNEPGFIVYERILE